MKKYRISNGKQTMTIYAHSETEALQSACADYLRGFGPVFLAITCEPV